MRLQSRVSAILTESGLDSAIAKGASGKGPSRKASIVVRVALLQNSGNPKQVVSLQVVFDKRSPHVRHPLARHS